MNQGTFQAKKEKIKQQWYIVDASGRVLGRLATEIVRVLCGKHKAFYSPHLDCGDCVIVTNAKLVRLTGNKMETKFDYRNSGYPGGDKYIPYKRLIQTMPERIIQLAVKGMLPKNKLRARALRRLKIYPGAEFPHGAQQPVELKIQDKRRQ